MTIPSEFDPLFTPRVLALLHEAAELAPDAPIEFGTLTDPEWLERTGGAMVQNLEHGRAVIRLDPARADEQIVAHELLHVILHRSGWPRAGSLRGESDKGALDLAFGINLAFDHWVITPRMVALGFDVERELFGNGDEPAAPEAHEAAGEVMPWLAFYIVGAMLYSPASGRRAKELLAGHHPQAWALAKELQHILESRRRCTPEANRRAMLETIEFLDEWACIGFGRPQRLRERLGVEVRELARGGMK